MTVLRAALFYWALVFAVGFVLGTLRVLWLEPQLGILSATLVELPVMLAVCWFAARWLIRKFDIRRVADALAMGGIAFALLMIAEILLTILLSGGSLASWFAEFMTPAGVSGLVGQVVFALMPCGIVRLERS